MRYLATCLLILAALAIGCSHEDPTRPTANSTDYSATSQLDPALTAAELVAVSGWERDPEVAVPDRAGTFDDKCLGFISDYTREELPGNVAHYSYTMRVGWGPYDFIKIHRVVKESRPYRPIRTQHAIFLQHGDAVGFVKFLFGVAAPSVPEEHSAAIFLAQNGVDVWGIDQNWVLVPEETAEFGFMQDWGMDNQIANLRQALATARLTRLFTGNGFRKMPLLGYSSGGWLGFSYLNDEAGRPGWQRHVNGFVNADAYFKCGPDNEVGRLLELEAYANFSQSREGAVEAAVRQSVSNVAAEAVRSLDSCMDGLHRKVAQVLSDESCVACGGTGVSSRGGRCVPCGGKGKVP